MSNSPSLELAGLVEGYRRFRDTEWEARRERWAALTNKQEPRVMVISCSDSRVDPAQVFDVDPGDIFVVRNVAALVPPYETTPGQHGVSAAVEFALMALKVKEIIVMGHGLCGGCKASLSQSVKGAEKGKGGFISDWIELLEDAREKVASKHGTEGRDAERAMEHEGVKVSLANLRTFPQVKELEDSGQVKLRGAFFAISDGILHLLDEESGEFEAVE